MSESVAYFLVLVLVGRLVRDFNLDAFSAVSVPNRRKPGSHCHSLTILLKCLWQDRPQVQLLLIVIVCPLLSRRGEDDAACVLSLVVVL